VKAWIGLVLALLVAAPVLAQDVDIKRPAPAPQRERLREPGVIEPGLSREERPIDADNYPPHGGRVPLEPAFFRGLSTKTSTGRIGLAGWTAPNIPLGGQVTGWRELNGWFAIGFTVTWGAPPEAPGRSAP
jgi:hypothetical protein